MKNYLVVLLLAINIGLPGQKGAISDQNASEVHLFDKLPSTIHIPAAAIADLIERKSGENVSITSSENLSLNGQVTKNLKWNETAQTVAFSLNSFPAGTKLIINRITRGEITTYKGHILNIKYPDAYQLTSYNNTEYVFSKTSTKNIVTD